MAQWKRRKEALPTEVYPSVLDGIKRIYETRLKPLETAYHFDEFHSPIMRDSDFEAKPQVLFLGQYSTGKTSFIRYLLEGTYPGMNIGPEPTTDRFVAVMGAKDEMIIPGNALVVQNDMPFRALTRFGNDFLNKFQASCSHSAILDDLVIIDTPGVLSGEKQRIGRSYDFTGVVEWFAQRADMIILVFDAHKLDISDEFRRAIEALRGQDDKIRVVLNKADGVGSQQLLRVYGALMWSLGKVFKTPEVVRVYVGSFWERPYQNMEFAKLFDAERDDLLRDLHSLPRQATVRKVNELVKRARLAKVHAYIVSYLKNEMPSVFGKKSKQEELVSNLNSVYNAVMQRYQLSPGDFPDIIRFRERLHQYDFGKFPKLNQKLIDQAEEALSTEIPKLVKMFPLEQQVTSTHTNPFELASPYEQRMSALHITEEDQKHFIDTFKSLHLAPNGRASGSEVKAIMMESRLPKDTLARIWSMVDRGHHGALSEEEFVIAMGLINIAMSGKPLPENLPGTFSSLPPGEQEHGPTPSSVSGEDTRYFSSQQQQRSNSNNTNNNTSSGWNQVPANVVTTPQPTTPPTTSMWRVHSEVQQEDEQKPMSESSEVRTGGGAPTTCEPLYPTDLGSAPSNQQSSAPDPF